MLQRVKEVQESDLRMVGSLARNIQRVLAVTQSDIDTAAAQGHSWLVKRVVKVNDPLDNMRGGTQLVIKQNSILPGQNVMRVLYSGGQAVVVGPGPSPLSLPGAAADDILSLTTFGGTEQHNLPIGYTLLDYIESTGTQYLDLGTKGNGNSKVSVEYRYHTATSATGSGRVFGSRTNSTNDAFAIGSASGVVAATGNKAFWCYDAQAFYVIDDPTFPIGDWQTVVFSATEHTLNGVSYGDDYNTVTFETPQNLKLFGFDNNGTMGYGLIDVARCKIWDNGVLIRDLVPCKNASNVVGMYDLVNDTFYQNAGTGDFVAGPNTVPTPTAPIDIVCNNGVLKFTPNEANYIADNVVLGYWLRNSDGQPEQSSANFYTNMMPVKPNTSYIAFGRKKDTDTISGYNRIAWYDSGGVWIRNSTYTANTPGIDTSPANAAFARFHCNPSGAVVTQELVDSYNWVFQVGTAEEPFTPYSPTRVYADGPIETIAIKDSNSSVVSTATAETLLSVDTYTDQQEVISGSVARKCGAVVLDSSFAWTYDGAYGRVNATIPNLWGSTVARTVPGLCTHFEWLSHQESISSITAGQCYSAGANRIFLHISQTSAAAFSTWLDAQKAAGTPVIIVFPLETATTETVTGQPMQTAAGDNTAEITQAGMAGLELEVEYVEA